VDRVRTGGLKIGATTGYTRTVLDLLANLARRKS
jgi:hypothetical protein